MTVFHTCMGSCCTERQRGDCCEIFGRKALAQHKHTNHRKISKTSSLDGVSNACFIYIYEEFEAALKSMKHTRLEFRVQVLDKAVLFHCICLFEP